MRVKFDEDWTSVVGSTYTNTTCKNESSKKVSLALPGCTKGFGCQVMAASHPTHARQTPKT